MVNGSLDDGYHTKDLGGHSFGPRGARGDHGPPRPKVLVGVVVTCTRPGLNHFFSTWTTPTFEWVSLLNQ